jgi:hypothetical protein
MPESAIALIFGATSTPNAEAHLTPTLSMYGEGEK